MTEGTVHSKLGASGAEFKAHPSLPLMASASGVVIYIPTNRILKPRPDKDGYLIADFGPKGDRRTIKVHRIVIACFEGESALEVDHKDRNRSNCAYENLAYKSIEANRRNIGTRRHSLTQIRNVRRGKNGRWVAYCRTDGRYKHLGVYDTAEEARKIAEAHYD